MTRWLMTFAIALTTTACESVPPLSFSDAADEDVRDARGDDASAEGSTTDASSPVDANAPGDAATAANTCPTVPSWATSCCGASQTCNGKCDANDCTKCQQCGPQKLCCPTKKLTCVALGAACPP